MPFDDKKFEATATKGDVAHAVISTALALSRVLSALRSLQLGKLSDKEVDELAKQIDKLDKLFTDLTGYTSE